MFAVQHKATQCSFRERDEADETDQQFEPDPPLSPAHRVDSVQTDYSVREDYAHADE